MPRIVLHIQRLPPAVRIDQRRRHQALFLDALRLGDGQRVALHGLDRAPHVDDLHAAPEQPVRLVGQMVRHARERRLVRLVDVHALHGAAQALPALLVRQVGLAGRVGGLPPDRVVEDEDAGGAGAGCWGQLPFAGIERWGEGLVGPAPPLFSGWRCSDAVRCRAWHGMAWIPRHPENAMRVESVR